MSHKLECPKCHSLMIAGKMLQFSGLIADHNDIWRQEKSKEEYESTGIDPDSYIAITYRCSNCGYLE